jgi:hypothetical protein
VPSNIGVGGMPVDEPTMMIKIIQEREFREVTLISPPQI